MTFSVLSTGWAWLLVAGAVALAVAAFLVRPRPPRHRVPSLLIWARVLDGPKDRSPWDRLRWLVSLVLTAALAAILALALARPLPGSGAASGGRLLLVLDASWTMLAGRPGGDALAACGRGGVGHGAVGRRARNRARHHGRRHR